MVGATRSLVHDYVSGHLNVHAQALYEDGRAAETLGPLLDLVLNTEQQRFEELAQEILQLSVLADSADEYEADRAPESRCWHC